eukprot:scaffold12057_cov133-Isochrysis_galbana.AAC.7
MSGRGQNAGCTSNCACCAGISLPPIVSISFRHASCSPARREILTWDRFVPDGRQIRSSTELSDSVQLYTALWPRRSHPASAIGRIVQDHVRRRLPDKFGTCPPHLTLTPPTPMSTALPEACRTADGRPLT